MSFLITVQVPGDVATFKQALAERGEEFKAVAERAKAAGAIHHRFGIGDGYVVAVDEWESIDGFQGFFGEPSMQEFIGSIGGDPAAEPTIIVSEATTSPDQF